MYAANGGPSVAAVVWYDDPDGGGPYDEFGNVLGG